MTQSVSSLITDLLAAFGLIFEFLFLTLADIEGILAGLFPTDQALQALILVHNFPLIVLELGILLLQSANFAWNNASQIIRS